MDKYDFIELAAKALGEYEVKNGGKAWDLKSEKSRARYRRRAECVYWTMAPDIMGMSRRIEELEELLRRTQTGMARNDIAAE